MIPTRTPLVIALFLLEVLAGVLAAPAASLNDMDHGPFVSRTIRGPSGSVTYKEINAVP